MSSNFGKKYKPNTIKKFNKQRDLELNPRKKRNKSKLYKQKNKPKTIEFRKNSLFFWLIIAILGFVLN